MVLLAGSVTHAINGAGMMMGVWCLVKGVRGNDDGNVVHDDGRKVHYDRSIC
jgi:hypothetical protein